VTVIYYYVHTTCMNIFVVTIDMLCYDVYHDIAFTRAGGGRNIFMSVGSNGSVRMFDLRQINM